jgi:hypothetical protein
MDLPHEISVPNQLSALIWFTSCAYQVFLYNRLIGIRYSREISDTAKHYQKTTLNRIENCGDQLVAALDLIEQALTSKSHPIYMKHGARINLPAESKIAMWFLFNDFRQRRGSNVAVDEYISQADADDVESNFAECLERARNTALPYWNSVIAATRLDKESVRWLRQQPTGGDSTTALAMMWSPVPGCYERHLQRKHSNPLFPLEDRQVSVAEVRAAQDRDAQDAQELEKEFREILEAISDMPEMVTWSVVNEVRERIDNLSAHALAVSGVSGLEVFDKLQQIHQVLIGSAREGMKNDPDMLDRLETSEQYYHQGKEAFLNTFVQQLTRDGTPINESETLPSLLSESSRVIESVVAVYDEKALKPIRAGARQVLQAAMKNGLPLEEATEKLKALGMADDIG